MQQLLHKVTVVCEERYNAHNHTLRVVDVRLELEVLRPKFFHLTHNPHCFGFVFNTEIFSGAVVGQRTRAPMTSWLDGRVISGSAK